MKKEFKILKWLIQYEVAKDGHWQNTYKDSVGYHIFTITKIISNDNLKAYVLVVGKYKISCGRIDQIDNHEIT